jgi:predicted lactoylglutathione lyase
MSPQPLKPDLFVNLCVQDVERSTEFFKALGFAFDPRFTNAFAACLIINERAHAMLLSEEHFKLFTPKPIVRAKESTEVLLALGQESKQAVVQLCEKAFEMGGRRYKEPDEHGSMFGWGFEDPDGHIWEVFWMNSAAVEDASIDH